MNIERQNITRGYEPVSKIDTNIMASHQALSKMGFPTIEINKVDAVTKARKRFVTRSKELAKLPKRGKADLDTDILASPTDPICDICGNSTGLGIAKLTSTVREAKLPDDWALVRFGSPNDSDYMAYVVVPLGIVIDYQSGRVYVVCGNCQLILGLRATEFGILINNMTEGTGYGFVDLNKVERLIEEYKR